MPRSGGRYLNAAAKEMKVRTERPYQSMAAPNEYCQFLCPHYSRAPHSRLDLQVCSGDVVNFSWSGETMGMFGFYTESAYNSCSKSDLNFIKNIHTSGSFDTKSNESGWRYYAYITDAGHGTCAQKIKIFWDKNC